MDSSFRLLGAGRLPPVNMERTPAIFDNLKDDTEKRLQAKNAIRAHEGLSIDQKEKGKRFLTSAPMDDVRDWYLYSNDDLKTAVLSLGSEGAASCWM